MYCWSFPSVSQCPCCAVVHVVVDVRWCLFTYMRALFFISVHVCDQTCIFLSVRVCVNMGLFVRARVRASVCS